MSAKSTPTNYGTVAVTIHWLSALLILVLIGSGFRAANTIEPDVKAQILSFHIPIGLAIMILTLARIAWWVFADRKPDPVAGMAKWQALGARAVHLLFYVVIIGMAASGIGMLVLSGAGPIIFTEAAGTMPDFHDYPPRTPHGLGARFMVLLFLFHAGAALYHQLIKKDELLSRMWFQKTGES
ncbi:MAG: cytochrome b/b6 domain-containing protein [Rhizobiaceae bacterium]